MADQSETESGEDEQETGLAEMLDKLSASLDKSNSADEYEDEPTSRKNDSEVEAEESTSTEKSKDDQITDKSGDDQPESVSIKSEGESENEDENVSVSHGREGENASQSKTNDHPSGVNDIRKARNIVQETAAELIGRPLDGIVEITNENGGSWRVIIEVIERRSVPDTQDILGRYDVSVDETGTISGYNRIRRYRRGDTRRYEVPD
jgi:hypothetical protein